MIDSNDYFLYSAILAVIPSITLLLILLVGDRSVLNKLGFIKFVLLVYISPLVLWLFWPILLPIVIYYIIMKIIIKMIHQKER